MSKILRLFDADGNWTGNPDHSITVNGVKHDVYEYAKANGIELPGKPHKKSKKQVNTDIQEKEHADLEQSHDSGHTEIDGDGDSEGSE